MAPFLRLASGNDLVVPDVLFEDDPRYSFCIFSEYIFLFAGWNS